MKKILTIAILLALFVPEIVLASPFLVCDPQVGVDYYTVSGLPASIDASHISVDPTGKYGFTLDLASLPVGTYTVRGKACSNLWGCSADSNPFGFTRPENTTGPINLRLIPSP